MASSSLSSSTQLNKNDSSIGIRGQRQNSLRAIGALQSAQVKAGDSVPIKGRVSVFSLPGCKHCRAAKSLLSERKVPYVEISLARFPERRAEMIERTGKRTVPQIFFNEKYVGGAAELKSLADLGAPFDELVQYVCDNVVDEDDEQVPALPLFDDDNNSNDNDNDNDDDLVDNNNDAAWPSVQCEDDPHYQLAERMRARKGGVSVKNRSWRMRQYRRCFVGSEAVTWLVDNCQLTRDEAVEMGEEMHRKHLFHHVCHDHDFRDKYLFYRFLADEKVKSLNAGDMPPCAPPSATAISAELRAHVMAVYDRFLSDDGHQVDYAGMSTSVEFAAYVSATRSLQRVDVSALDVNEKLAFFINCYNALVVHATVELGAPNSFWSRRRFFSSVGYLIGGHTYALNDIEHGILRANAKAPFSLSRHFAKGDPRAAFCLSADELNPRIHFALVCGAASCPSVRAYSADQIVEQLADAAFGFFESPASLAVNVDKRRVHLSRLLDWYGADFGNKRAMLEFVARHAGGTNKTMLETLLESDKPIDIRFFKYNWHSNAKED